jgi:hypothetical protein
MVSRMVRDAAGWPDKRERLVRSSERAWPSDVTMSLSSQLIVACPTPFASSRVLLYMCPARLKVQLVPASPRTVAMDQVRLRCSCCCCCCCQE